MAVAGKARAGIGARTVVGAVVLTAAFLAGAPGASWAQAPIVYKASAPTTSPDVRFENKAEGALIAVAPHAPIPTFAASPNAAGAIDLRPGTASASFGPALPTPTSRVEAPRSLASSKPVMAEPYAGPPYEVDGRWYVPAYEPNYDEVGIASWYGPTFHGKDAASGEVFDEMAMTAAHPTLPIPSLVRVTNLTNGKSVIVRLNDRGPFVDDRIIDLSRAAGMALDMHDKGTAKVRVQYVGPAPAEANSLPAAKPGQVQKVDIVSKPVAPIVPAAMPAPAPIQPARPAAQTGFFLQAGSFADLANANQLRNQLRASGSVSVTSANVGGTEYYRVMVGPWASRAEAEDAQNRLGQAGTKTIVVSK